MPATDQATNQQQPVPVPSGASLSPVPPDQSVDQPQSAKTVAVPTNAVPVPTGATLKPVLSEAMLGTGVSTPHAQPVPAGASLQPVEQDSTWSKVKSFLTHPLLSESTMPPELMLPVTLGEQAEKYFQSHGHPTAAKVAGAYTGAQQAGVDLVRGMTSPLNLGVMAATGGLGAMEGVAGPVVARLTNLGFSFQSLYNAYRNVPEIRTALKSGNVQEAARLLTESAANVGMAGTAGLHALGGVHPGVSETPENSIHSAPVARIVPSEAAKTDAEAQTSVPVGEGTSAVMLAEGEAPRANVEQQIQSHTEEINRLERIKNDPRASAEERDYAEKGIEASTAQRVALQNAGENGSKTAPAPTKESPITYGDDSIGRYATAPDVPARIYIPKDLEGPDADAYAREKLDLQRQFLASHPTVKTSNGDSVPVAKVVTDDHTPVVSRDELLAEATNRVLRNSQALQTIADPEAIESRGDVEDILNRTASHIEQNLDPRVGVRISLDAQKQLAASLGMSVEDLLTRKSGTAFSAEQALAARALLRDSQTRIMNLARNAATGDEGYQANFAKALAQHQEILRAVKGVTSEAGRALGSFRVGDADLPEVRAADVLSQLSPDAAKQAATLISKLNPSDPGYERKMNELIEEITPSSTPDKLFEAYRNALLSSPSTVIKKAASEAVMMALEATKKSVMGGLEKAKAAAGISDNPQAFASEGFWYAKGAAQALPHAREILSGEFDLADAPDFERTGQRAIKGTAGQIVRVPSTILSRQTNLVYAMNYFGELNALAARQAVSEGLKGESLAARQEYLAQHPTPEMSDKANETALHNTFQNRLGKTGESLQSALKSNPVLKWVFPFFRTPVNLVKASGEYSPYGLLKGTAKGDLDLQTKGFLGSSILAALGYLAANGNITGGGPVNYRQRQTKEATGWQPYSVKLGGKFYGYHKAEPLGLSLGMAADLVHGIQHDESPAVTASKRETVLNHLSRNVQDLPFLMQLSEIVDALTGQSSPERMVDNLLASAVVPSGVRNVALGLDPTVRSSQHEGLSNPVTGLAQTVEARVPGLTRNVPPDIDVTGQNVERPASALGGANPFPVTTERPDPVTAELARLGITVENAPTKPITLRWPDGKRRIIPGGSPTAEESAELQRQETVALYRQAGLAMRSPGWKRIPDEEKKKVIAELRSKTVATRLARLRQLRAANDEKNGPAPSGFVANPSPDSRGF